MVSVISDIRIAPVGEDLTTEDLKVSVLRGLETMKRVDKPWDTGEVLASGEWGVLNATGKMERAGATPVLPTYLIFAGTDRFDAHATGQVTAIMASEVIVKSSVFDPAPTYAVGSLLTVKDLGAGESRLTLHTAGEVALAMVLEVGPSDSYLVYQTLPPAVVA